MISILEIINPTSFKSTKVKLYKDMKKWAHAKSLIGNTFAKTKMKQSKNTHEMIAHEHNKSHEKHIINNS